MATGTLEPSIDVGDLDLVSQINAPPTAAAFYSASAAPAAENAAPASASCSH